MDNVDEKERRRKTREDSVAETLVKWKEYNATKLESCATPKVLAKESMKGCMKGKGGPENSQFRCRGVRKRTWDKWVTEICEPKGGKRLWLGTFDTTVDVAFAYDEATKTMYAASA